MSIEIKEPLPDQANKIRLSEEGQLSDVKTKGDQTENITTDISTLANTDEGDLSVENTNMGWFRKC